MVFWEDTPEDVKSLLIGCSCHKLTHLMRFSYFIEKDGSVSDASFEISLNPFLPWYRRLWLGLRYIIKPLSNAGWTYYDNVILDKEDARKLNSALFCMLEK